jgi:Leucine-rich repeat (LRR) protein
VYLNFSNNKITQIDSQVFKNKTQLKTINLELNQLKQLPSTIGECSSLSTLILSFNQLSTLPSSICQLSDLEVLLLSGNQLTTLPSNIENLKNLRTLILKDNPMDASEINRIKKALPLCTVIF